jgi:hypothetical protein
MTADATDAVAKLLAETEGAHGVYETTELNGVYDVEWAKWYAVYAVDHGIAGLLGHAVSAERLAAFLASTFVELQQTEPKPAESWPAYTARRITAEF